MRSDPMDEADIAADYQSRLNKDAVARVQREIAGEARSCNGAEAADCEWCGEEIPAARRAAYPGCGLCVQCQATKERLPGRAE